MLTLHDLCLDAKTACRKESRLRHNSPYTKNDGHNVLLLILISAIAVS